MACNLIHLPRYLKILAMLVLHHKGHQCTSNFRIDAHADQKTMLQNLSFHRLRPVLLSLVLLLMIGALVSDLLAPVGPVALWLSAAAGALLLMLSLFLGWDQQRLAALMAGESQFATALMLAAGAMLGFFLLGAIAMLGPRNGYLATALPPVAAWQERTLGAELAVDQPEDAAQAAANPSDPANATPIETLQADFAALQATATPVAEPQTPPEWVHNARLAVARGEIAQAQDAYNQALASNLDLVDLWLEAMDLIRRQEGNAAARTWIEEQQANHPNSPVLMLAAALSVEEPTDRLARLQTLSEQMPAFGPVFYHLVLEYDALLRQQFTQRRAQAQRTAYTTLEGQIDGGNFGRYYLDQELANRALNRAQQRVAATTRLAERLQLDFFPYFSTSGVTVDVVLPDPNVQSLRFAVDGGAFQSTGVISGTQNAVNTTIGPLPLEKGKHTLTIQYTDAAGEESPQYTFAYTVADLVVNVAPGAFDQEAGGFPVQFTIAVVEGQAEELYTFRYSVDGPALDQEQLGLGAGTVLQIAPVSAGEHTLYVQAQLTETTTSVVTYPFTVR
jgi:hypothetical protein